jgi:lipopolysaccharide export system permease protein
MLLDTTFRKDLSRAFGVTLVVLVTIVVTIMLIKTLGQAAGGRVAAQDVVMLLGFAALSQLPIVLTLALFVAVVSTLARMYRESEMAVWHACGVPLRRMVRPLLRVVMPILVVITALVMVAWPWGNAQSQQLRERYEKRSDLSRVAPGQFQASRDGSKVFFIERDSDLAGVGRNVFILSQQGSRESVTTAATGQITWDGDDRHLVLEQGQRNETSVVASENTLARFDRYRVLADRQATRNLDELPPKAMSTVNLWNSSETRHRAELVWRAGMVLGAFNLALLGLGLAATNPRRPNSWGLLIALLVFVVYFNLINLSQSWVGRGKLGATEALLIIHGSAFMLAMLMLTWRDESIRIASMWQRRAT